jgi:nucleotide-binding universal stress UspA family protein
MPSSFAPLSLPRGKVLACVDDSRYAEAVVDYAAWSALQIEEPLSLLHVIDAPTGGAVEPRQNLTGAIGFGARRRLLEELASLDEQRARLAMEHGRHLLHAACERVRDRFATKIETRQRHGELVDAVMALESETRMLVLGKRGVETAPDHGHLGANLERVIRAMSRPILVAQQSFSPPRRIMFAYDGSPTARKGVAMVAASPLFRDIPCHLVFAGRDAPEPRRALEEASRALEDAGFEAPTAIVEGDPEDALPRYQAREEIDLLVMGAYGHSRIRRLFLGSTTSNMIRRCTVSLMVLR